METSGEILLGTKCFKNSTLVKVLTAVKENAFEFLGCTQRKPPSAPVTDVNTSVLLYQAFFANYQSY